MLNARWPSERSFLCAGRAGFPEILQIFRAIFAQNLRDLIIDAGLARSLALEKTTPTRNHAARVHALNFCARSAPKDAPKTPQKCPRNLDLNSNLTEFNLNHTTEIQPNFNRVPTAIQQKIPNESQPTFN